MGILDNPFHPVIKNAVDGKVSKGDLSVNVKDYGAKGDGTTDDTASINAAINAAPPESTIWFEPGKTYALYGSITNNGKSIHLRSNNAKLISKTHTAQIDFAGSWGAVYAVSALAAGTITTNGEDRAVINLTVTGTLPYLRGDVVKVYADDLIPGARPGTGTLESRVGQFGVVYESSSGNLAVLVRELLDPMTTNIRVSKLNDITASIEGFVFDTDEALMNDGGKSNCITFTDLARPRAVSLQVRNSTAQAIQLNSCYAYRVKDVEINESNDSSVNSQFGYGVLDNSSSHGIIEGLTANFVRHAYSDDSPRIAASSGPSLYGRTYNIVVKDSTSYGTSNTSWDTHAASQNVRFVDCVALGSGGPGFGLRGRKHVVSGGMVGAGRDSGLYIFAEGSTDTESWGHTVEGLTIESPVSPVLIALNKASNSRENRRTYLSDIRIISPKNRSLWFSNATVEIGRVLINDCAMDAANTQTIEVVNSDVLIDILDVKYRAGISSTGLNTIRTSGASSIKIKQADLDLNGTTNGTRFNPLVEPTDTTNYIKIRDMMLTSNPSSVMPFQNSQTDSYLDYMTPAGNALGISSAHIPWSSGSPINAQHQLSRTLAPNIIYPGNITSNYTLASLRSGRFMGQLLTIINVGTAVLTVNNATSITTLTGAAITISPTNRAQFYWDATTWRQIA